MKKKRSGKKKSIQNNKPNNNVTTAEVTIIPDKHHNWSRPCSALAASISQEIFPSIPSSNRNDTIVPREDDIMCDGDGSTSLSKGKLLLTQQPLLAFIILQHMIEERKKIRDEEKGVLDNKGTELSTGEELNTLLDSYIDSKEACDILDNEAKRWGERNIESFVSYLTQNFNCHAKKLQKKLANVNSLSLQDTLGANALVLKDVLPTISSMDTALLQPIECSTCRKSFDEQLSKMIEEPTISLAVDMASTNNIPFQVEATLSIGQEVIMGSYEHNGRIWPGGHGTITDIYYDMYTKADTISVEYSSNNWKHDQIPIKYIKVLPEDMSRNTIEYEEVVRDDVGEEVLAKIDVQVRNGMEQIQKSLKSINNLFFGMKEGLHSLYPTPDQKDIEVVMSQTSCKRETAIKAIQLNDYDLVNAIMSLTTDDAYRAKLEEDEAKKEEEVAT